jgi:hypothetical protein
MSFGIASALWLSQRFLCLASWIAPFGKREGHMGFDRGSKASFDDGSNATFISARCRQLRLARPSLGETARHYR